MKPYITVNEIRNTSDAIIVTLLDDLIDLVGDNEAVIKLLNEYNIEYE